MDSDARAYADFTWDRWERLRRHPDYILFCHQYIKFFDFCPYDIGIAGIGFLDDPEANIKLQEIKEIFNLRTVFFYCNNFSSSDLLALPQIFNHGLAIDAGTIKKISSGEHLFSFVTDETSPEIIECLIDTSRPIREIRSELSSIIKHSRSELYGKEKSWSGERPWVVKGPARKSLHVDKDGWITCRLDISLSMTMGKILNEISKIAKIIQKSQVRVRRRLKENKLALRVYDLRIEQDLKFDIIARNCNITPVAARKKYSRAQELIHSMSNQPLNVTGREVFMITHDRWSEISPDNNLRETYISDKMLYLIY